jgi:hypothetical protein
MVKVIRIIGWLPALLPLAILFPSYINPFETASSGGFRNAWAPDTPLCASLFLFPSAADRQSAAPAPTAVLWSAADFPYRKRRAVANASLTIALPAGFSAPAGLSVRMVVRPVACAHCAAQSAEAPLLQWRTPARARRRLLGPAPSPTPYAYHFGTVRFDLLYEDRALSDAIDVPGVTGSMRRNARARLFWPPVTRDSFFDVDSQRRLVNLSAPNVTVRLEFNVRGYYVWFLKRGLDMAIGGPLIKGWLPDDFTAFLDGQWKEIKSTFIGANPILLWTTAIASVLHTFFAVRAFEKDLQFWRAKKNMTGVSLRTVALQFFSELILFGHLLYLKNRRPIYILGVQMLQILKEIWKIGKLVKVSRKFPFVATRDEYGWRQMMWMQKDGGFCHGFLCHC